ncbi:MAG: RNA polymerase sigma-70 factor [Bacteroidia bacterium]
MEKDIQLFEKLFRQYRPGLLAFARNILNDHEEAEEVIHDIFLSIWEKRSDMFTDPGLKSYLFRAVKNRCLNVLRKAKLDFEELPDQVPELDTSAIASELLEAKETEKLLAHLIEQLPKKCKQAFLLSRVDGLSHKEVAEIMDISAKTVENQIGIALKFFKENLGHLRH